MSEPDFEKLRAERNVVMKSRMEAIGRKHGFSSDQVQLSFDPNSCYCVCPDGPCEHDFQGWRSFEDGSGGETVCQRCGMGAMHHSLMTSE